MGGPPYFIFQSDGSLVWPEGANLTDVRLAAPSNINTYSNLPLGISGEGQNTVSMDVYSLAVLRSYPPLFLLLKRDIRVSGQRD